MLIFNRNAGFPCRILLDNYPRAALASIFFVIFMLMVSLVLLSVLLAITIEAFVMSRDVAEVRWGACPKPCEMGHQPAVLYS